MPCRSLRLHDPGQLAVRDAQARLARFARDVRLPALVFVATVGLAGLWWAVVAVA